MIVVSFPRSNANVRALVQGLWEAKLLESFHTTLHFEPSDPVMKFLPAGLRESLLKRFFGIPKDVTHQYPGLEIVRLLSSKNPNLSFLTKSYRSFASVDATYMDLDRNVARYLRKRAASPAGRTISGVYCYEDGAVETFTAGKSLGLRTYYELTIPYWKTAHEVLGREARKRPEWACTIDTVKDPPEKLAVKTRELELADVVLCISKFVQYSLPEDLVTGKKVVVVPYGLPPLTGVSVPLERPTNKKLRVLFVGILTQRKGLADIFDAIKLLKRSDVELVVLGAPVAPLSFYKQQLDNFTYIPPCPLSEVLEVMQTCDVFVFPSLLEGRGLVQLEAMSCGLPLITTVSATGDDLVENGRNGFIVPSGDPQSIAEKIAWFADHRQETRLMGEESRIMSMQWQWSRYMETVLGAMSSDQHR